MTRWPLRCVIDQQFHPENAQQVMRQVRHLQAISGQQPIYCASRQADGLLDRLKLEAEYRRCRES